MAPNDFNQSIIDEFRANAGVVGGPFEGVPVLLIHHTGRKSGEVRLNPLAYQAVDGAWAIFASMGGAPRNPDWYYNLISHPDTTAEIGSDTVQVTVREATGSERDAIWEKQKKAVPGFAEYEEKAAPRQIPVLILEPR